VLIAAIPVAVLFALSSGCLGVDDSTPSTSNRDAPSMAAVIAAIRQQHLRVTYAKRSPLHVSGIGGGVTGGDLRGTSLNPWRDVERDRVPRHAHRHNDGPQTEYSLPRAWPGLLSRARRWPPRPHGIDLHQDGSSQHRTSDPEAPQARARPRLNNATASLRSMRSEALAR
jgi:hypothetical protein